MNKKQKLKELQDELHDHAAESFFELGLDERFYPIHTNDSDIYKEGFKQGVKQGLLLALSEIED